MSFYSLNLCYQETSSSHTSAEALYYSRVTRWWTPKDGWKSETLVHNCTRLEWPLWPRGVCEHAAWNSCGTANVHVSFTGRRFSSAAQAPWMYSEQRTDICMRVLLNHEHVQGSSRTSDLTPAQSRRSPGPCRAQSLPGFSAGLLLWGCISCFHAVAVGLLITLEDERSEPLPFWSFNEAYVGFTNLLQLSSAAIAAAALQRLCIKCQFNIRNTPPELSSPLSVEEVEKQQLVCSFYTHWFPPGCNVTITTSGSHQQNRHRLIQNRFSLHNFNTKPSFSLLIVLIICSHGTIIGFYWPLLSECCHYIFYTVKALYYWFEELKKNTSWREVLRVKDTKTLLSVLRWECLNFNCMNHISEDDELKQLRGEKPDLIRPQTASDTFVSEKTILLMCRDSRGAVRSVSCLLAKNSHTMVCVSLSTEVKVQDPIFRSPGDERIQSSSAVMDSSWSPPADRLHQLNFGGSTGLFLLKFASLSLVLRVRVQPGLFIDPEDGRMLNLLQTDLMDSAALGG